MNNKLNLYVLAGAWEYPDDLGVAVIAVSDDENILIEKLKEIAKTKAKDYVNFTGELEEDLTDTRYEISGEYCGNARFYVTQERAIFTDCFFGEIARLMDESYKKEDVKNYLLGEYENENISEEEYNAFSKDENFLKKAVELVGKMEDSNHPYNLTLEEAVDRTIIDIKSSLGRRKR